MTVELERVSIGGVWQWQAVNEGGGGSQTLADVLQEGDDADGGSMRGLGGIAFGASSVTPGELHLDGGDTFTNGGDIFTAGGRVSVGAGDVSGDSFTSDNIPTNDEKAALGAAAAPDMGNPFATIADLATLPDTDEKAALDGANAPDAGNVFATMADVGGGGVSNPMVATLDLGGNLIVAGSGNNSIVKGGTGAETGDLPGVVEVDAPSGAGGAALLTGGDGDTGNDGGRAAIVGGGGNGASTFGAQVIAGAGTGAAHGKVQVFTDNAFFEWTQMPHLADGSTVNQLRDALIAAGLMAPS